MEPANRRACAARFPGQGARVVVCDLDGERAVTVAAEIGAVAAVTADVGSDGVRELIAAATESCGADRPVLLECGHSAVRSASPRRAERQGPAAQRETGPLGTGRFRASGEEVLL